MSPKNYYQILHVHPISNAETIRKAYRKLALQYHPDITNQDSLLTEKFAEIKEAYDVLSNPVTRKKFHNAFYFTAHKQSATSIPEIFEQANQLKLFVANSDIFRIDYLLIVTQLEELLSTPHLEVIQLSKDLDTKDKLMKAILNILEVLNFENLLPFKTIITANFPEIQIDFHKLLQQKKRSMLWEKYSIAVALIFAIGFCVVMVLLA
jgi:DnaJ-domain-containing protein 1